MTVLAQSNDCEVAVIGAGPYGLAAACHLKASGIATRAFGEPMSFWRDNMPKGMFLRSPWRASHIADPQAALSLDDFGPCQGIRRDQPLPLATFVDYGTWFQRNAVADLDRRRIERIEAAGGGFRLVASQGEPVHARRVIVAMGLAGQQYRPAAFDHVPQALASHSSDCAAMDSFAGKRVAVVGRGQSACETAALLAEAGAEVELVCRGPVHWLGAGTNGDNPRHAIKRRLAEMVAAPSAVGPFPLAWLVEAPGVVHLLPGSLRDRFNLRSLRAGAAGWLRPRFGAVRVLAGRPIVAAEPQGERIALQFDQGSAAYDHVILATGYKFDVRRLGLFGAELAGAIRCREGSPVLANGLESSVPGLHFIGASAVASFGPLLRFVAGTGFAARTVTRAVLADRRAARQVRSSEGEDFARAPQTVARH